MKRNNTIFNQLATNANETNKFINNFCETNEKLSSLLIEIILPYFSKRGWYISLELDPKVMVKLAEAIKCIEQENGQKQESEIEEALKDIVRDSIQKIEKEVCLVWPARELILRDAFSAHKDKKYTLSIPTLLAQSDGICHEMTGMHLFSNYDGNLAKKYHKKLESIPHVTPLRKAFFHLIISPTSVIDRKKKRDVERSKDSLYAPLNRHEILHGIDLDYATEENSLRCISLLSFLILLNDYRF